MKNFFALALAAALCLAPLALHAAPPAKWQMHVGFLSGATTAIQGEIYLPDVSTSIAEIHQRERNRGTAALAAGVFGLTRAVSPRARLGADVHLGWTDTAFRTDIYDITDFERRIERGFTRISDRQFSDPRTYDFKTALNLRFFWDTQLRPLPIHVFALAGYQFRRARVGGTRVSASFPGSSLRSFDPQRDLEIFTNARIDHGYQIGLGADVGILPAASNLKWRLEYVFAENFGNYDYPNTGRAPERYSGSNIDHRLSSHDVHIGFVYYFNLGKRQPNPRR